MAKKKKCISVPDNFEKLLRCIMYQEDYIDDAIRERFGVSHHFELPFDTPFSFPDNSDSAIIYRACYFYEMALSKYFSGEPISSIFE